jgi:creatinine amidohydrolase/Fe(II)-dependent formamide hydrolase-like protein
MVRAPSRRTLAELAFPEVSGRLKASSILCLPLGAIEQHGPHLPLNTDVIVAEGITRRILAKWGDTFDLWQLPTLPLGLSREHDWAPGTLSLSIDGFLTLIRDLAGEIVRALPARNLAIINGHGGNRGILENLLHELRGDFSLNCCVLHPFDLSQAGKPRMPDVHGGCDETSVMLVLAPDLVRQHLIAGQDPVGDPKLTQQLIFDRGVTWPWRTDDRRLAQNGVIGDAGAASAERGNAIIESVVKEAGAVFAHLIAQQQFMHGAPSAPQPRRRALPARTSSRSGNRRRPRPKGTS